MFELGKSSIFFIKALLLGIAFIISVPKEQYRKFLIYGIFFGGFLDMIVILISSELNLLKYYDMKAFSIFGVFPFWTPIAWMFALGIFFFYLPIRKPFFYLYIIVWAIFGVFVGLVLQGFGLYSFNEPALFIVFILWFSFSGSIFIHLEKITLKPGSKRCDK